MIWILWIFTMWCWKEKNLSQSENEEKANWWNHKPTHSREHSLQSQYYSNWSIQRLSIQSIQSHCKYWQQWWVWKWWKEWKRILRWIQLDKTNPVKAHYLVECYIWILNDKIWMTYFSIFIKLRSRISTWSIPSTVIFTIPFNEWESINNIDSEVIGVRSMEGR